MIQMRSSNIFSTFKSEFKGQIVLKFDLGLLNTYKLMYFDKNINGNKDSKRNLRAINETCVTLHWVNSTLVKVAERKIVSLAPHLHTGLTENY